MDVPSITGNFGILPNHVPSIAVLKPGVVNVYESESNKKFFGAPLRWLAGVYIIVVYFLSSHPSISK